MMNNSIFIERQRRLITSLLLASTAIFFRCEPPCVHGECIKHPFNVSLDECKCDLGWTGSECDVNCGCHNHSTCTTAVGVCDECKGKKQMFSLKYFCSKLGFYFLPSVYQ